MHKLLLTVIIACLAWVATAQRTTQQPASSGRSGTTNTLAPTSSTPAATTRSTPATPRSTPTPQLTPKSGTTRTETAAPERSTYSPRLTPKSGTSSPEVAKDRSTTTATNSATRPARTSSSARKTTTTSHYNGNGTARTVTTPAKKAPSLKPVKPVEPVVIHWLTLDEAIEKNKTEKRKIFIDVFTDWCGWCKRMDETTFTDPAVAQYMNDHFYAVKFNAEQTGDILFNNKTYRFKSSGGRGYHELAAEWLNNRLSFPTSVFLDENQNLIQSLPNYQDAPKLEAILNYFGTDSHRTTPWETYQKNFSSSQ